MNRDTVYFEQADLMVRMIPFVAEETCFALKGGTAINFFIRNIPRLSVDIDLTYLPLEDRDTSLTNISAALKRIAAAIRKAHNKIKVQEGTLPGTKNIIKLFVNAGGSAQIKIEPNLILRGAVFGAETRTVSPKVEEIFQASAEIQVVSIPDLYGGKLCAALDRQHPRDMYDMKLLLDNEGITPEIQRAFVVYLAGHDRSIHELIEPTRLDMQEVYDREFAGMTVNSIPYQELVRTREQYIATLKKGLTASERQFLLSLKEITPKYDLLGVPNLDRFPAIQWKLLNLQKMKPNKRAEWVTKLKAVLGNQGD